MSADQPRRRVPIEERREQILDAALREFSRKGLHGGSTVAIAADVGVSQPNIFRIYPTKKQLFVAALERVFGRVARTMLVVGEREAEWPLEAMADAWGELMADRENMLMLLQGFAASDDEEISEHMRGWTRDVFEAMSTLGDIGDDTSHDFFAAGMLYMVAAAMDLPARAAAEEWVERFLESGS